MQMIQCMETVPSWFTASWKDSLTFLLSPTQVGDPEQQPLPWEITSACSREAGIRDWDKFLHGKGLNCVDVALGAMDRVGNAWAPCLRGFFQPGNSGCVCRGGHPLPLITCAPQSLIPGKTTGKTGINGNGGDGGGKGTAVPGAAGGRAVRQNCSGSAGLGLSEGSDEQNVMFNMSLQHSHLKYSLAWEFQRIYFCVFIENSFSFSVGWINFGRGRASIVSVGVRFD